MAFRLSKDESRAVAFIGFLLAASAGARMLGRPAAFQPAAPAVDLAELERANRQKAAGPEKLRPGERIDPNTSPLEQLMRLPGASRAVAERIVADRAAGAYRTADDLRRIRGIGPATVDRWRDLLALPATVAGRQTAPVAGSTRNRADSPPAGPMDVNRAGEEELQRLPGVGPVLARRIVAYRDSVGGFRAVEQLEEVRGVGPAMMRRLAPLIRVGS